MGARRSSGRRSRPKRRAEQPATGGMLNVAEVLRRRRAAAERILQQTQLWQVGPRHVSTLAHRAAGAFAMPVRSQTPPVSHSPLCRTTSSNTERTERKRAANTARFATLKQCAAGIHNSYSAPPCCAGA
eukprot:scaffold286586_cov39-Tisochrysis_lutea.AAC.1